MLTKQHKCFNDSLQMLVVSMWDHCFPAAHSKHDLNFHTDASTKSNPSPCLELTLKMSQSSVLERAHETAGFVKRATKRKGLCSEELLSTWWPLGNTERQNPSFALEHHTKSTCFPLARDALHSNLPAAHQHWEHRPTGAWGLWAGEGTVPFSVVLLQEASKDALN